jgi:hypothetical protein
MPLDVVSFTAITRNHATTLKVVPWNGTALTMNSATLPPERWHAALKVVPWNGTALVPLQRLAQELDASLTDDRLNGLSFADLRDKVLAAAPLDPEHVKRVNRCEAEFWKKSVGVTGVDSSDKVLGFDCGGSQWVDERAIPAGSLASPTMADMEFMTRLLNLIEENNVAAPAPIEQRWTSASSSAMSINSDVAADSTLGGRVGTVLVFRQDFALEDAIGSHACSLEANMRVTNGIPLGSPLPLPLPP